MLYEVITKSEVRLEKLSSNRTFGTDIMDYPPVTLPEPEKKELIKPPVPVITSYSIHYTKLYESTSLG